MTKAGVASVMERERGGTARKWNPGVDVL
ncbi:hypothetical protein ANCCAN_18669 [Ancylostoma caninum]|uniref:Uncharacterized protein n=1 Tax=Ancylostoma caninum TaxID=29170 RepID=A0A368FTD9_ANCCA|nr:hypothetical protein ANCCAN_18669 [Ancylostoma caninum]